MNEKNYFTIVVPLSPDAQKIVQGNPSAVPLRAAVWSQAAERMKPLLGGVCSRFSPAVAPYQKLWQAHIGAQGWAVTSGAKEGQ